MEAINVALSFLYGDSINLYAQLPFKRKEMEENGLHVFNPNVMFNREIEAMAFGGHLWDAIKSQARLKCLCAHFIPWLDQTPIKTLNELGFICQLEVRCLEEKLKRIGAPLSKFWDYSTDLLTMNRIRSSLQQSWDEYEAWMSAHPGNHN